MKDNGGCFLNTFLILGLLALILVVTYRVAFYARYLDLEKDEVVFDWTGGEQDIWVYTDANSWVVEDGGYLGWATCYEQFGELHIHAFQNNSKELLSADVKIRSGAIKGLGNKVRWLKVVQKGKQATYLTSSKQTISFPDKGGTEKVQINTDGDGWSVVKCPNWITTSISGNTLSLSASANHGMPRIDSLHLQSGEEVSKIEVSQYGNSVFTVNGVSFVMKFVEGGTYMMGSNNSEWDDEKPAHKVTLSSFYIGETEVTQALWKAVMGDRIPSYYYRDYYIYRDNDRPIEVNWNECWEFINKLNGKTRVAFRLPTEAEWEYAARGGIRSRGYKYAGSNYMDAVAWFFGEDNVVKQKQPNELGLYDMSGNVMEWCSDWYGPYSSSPQIDPQGPSDCGSWHVSRGGTGVMESGPEDCQVTNRNASSHAGIRLCLQQ